MERININITLDQNQIDERKKLYANIKDDQRIIDFLNKHNLDNKFLYENVLTFSQWILGLDECKRCNSVEDCVLNVDGYYLDLDYDQILIKSYKPCDFLKKINQQERFLSKYVIRDYPDELVNVNLASINIDGEPLAYLDVLTTISSFIDSSDHVGYYLYGSVGVGKTYLMAALANELAKLDYKIAFVHLPTLASHLRNLISENISLDDYINKLKHVDVVVFDDIGAESVTNWFRDEILLQILNYRMEAKKTCFYTSNLSMNELEAYYLYNNKKERNELASLRIMERIRSTSREIQLVGKNRRNYHSF